MSSQTSWVEHALANLDAMLADHAHCEKKAAVNAMSMVNRYSDRVRLVREMIALAQEELEHFQRVYSIIIERGGTLSRDPGDPYVQALHREIRSAEPERLLDSLLVAALVEARSCERFSILAQRINDPSLRTFYAELLASEATHYRTFYDVSCDYFPEAIVRKRLDSLADREAAIVLELHSIPTIHG